MIRGVGPRAETLEQSFFGYWKLPDEEGMRMLLP